MCSVGTLACGNGFPALSSKLSGTCRAAKPAGVCLLAPVGQQGPVPVCVGEKASRC